MSTILFSVLMLILGLIIGYLGVYFLQIKKKEYLRQKAKDIIKNAEIEKENILKKAEIDVKDYTLTAKNQVDEEIREKRKEIQKWEKRIQVKEEALDKKQFQLDSKQEQLNKKLEEIKEKEHFLEQESTKLANLVDEQKRKIEEIAKMTTEEAKEHLVKQIEDAARKEAVIRLREIEEEINESAKKISQKILSLTMEKMSSTFVMEKTISTVSLPNDEMKGRIIGREGRNIRSFEKETGVDLIIDDTPEVVVISSFDAKKREIAKVALEKLIQDGRIHPARIEEVVEKVKQELEQEAIEEVKSLIFDLGIENLHTEIIRHLSMLKYRTSYTQNVLAHSVEVAYMSGIMAAELGLNIKLAKRAGLLHDIGKSTDQEMEGSHTVIGAEIARKYGENEYVINAIMSHHGEVEPNCIESVLVSIADTLSAARPGARMEVLENYIKRLEELEKIAKKYKNVKNAYAIQAGRELRVIVEDQFTNDNDAFLTAKEIADEIKENMTYTGQVKVVAIRELRAIEYAN